MNRLATGLATGTLLALAGCTSLEHGPSPAELLKKQKILAAPYAGCVLKNIVETDEPPALMPDAERRETITMDIAFTTSPEARKLQQDYAKDDSFVWNHSLGAELTMVPKGSKHPVAAQVNNSVIDGETQRRFELYPMKNIYQPGATIDVFAQTTLWGHGTEVVENPGEPDKTTRQWCGRLVLVNESWTPATK